MTEEETMKRTLTTCLLGLFLIGSLAALGSAQTAKEGLDDAHFKMAK